MPDEQPRPLASYLYTLQLDDLALAWECMRRDPAYLDAWHRGADRSAAQWGLTALEDPALDGREAMPLWKHEQVSAKLVSVAEGPCFDFWSLPGIKQAIHLGDRVRLRLTPPGRAHLLTLANGLGQGDGYGVAIVPTASPAAIKATLEDIAVLTGTAKTARIDILARAAILNMRSLALVDWRRCTLSERDCAIGLFGAQRVAAEWTPESALRRSVRDLHKRGEALVQGKWRRLLHPPA